jgi:hypothetical protein
MNRNSLALLGLLVWRKMPFDILLQTHRRCKVVVYKLKDIKTG